MFKEAVVFLTGLFSANWSLQIQQKETAAGLILAAAISLVTQLLIKIGSGLVDKYYRRKP